MKKRLIAKGYTLIEYSLLLGVIIVAILSMAVYVSRGLGGHFRDVYEGFETERFDRGRKLDTQTHFYQNISSLICIVETTEAGFDIEKQMTTTNINKDEVRRSELGEF